MIDGLTCLLCPQQRAVNHGIAHGRLTTSALLCRPTHPQAPDFWLFRSPAASERAFFHHAFLKTSHNPRQSFAFREGRCFDCLSAGRANVGNTFPPLGSFCAAPKPPPIGGTFILPYDCFCRMSLPPTPVSAWRVSLLYQTGCHSCKYRLAHP